MTTQEMINAIKNGEIKKNLINGESNDKELAWGTHFAQSIYSASQFFVSYLWLGGSYNYNTEDKKVIVEKLEDIAQILAKYE
jgi:hypothetical protein